MKFIHISDFHLHRSKKDNKCAVKLLKLIEQRYPAHYLIVTGDITDDGDAEQYDRAAEALSAFAGRMFICPGNHDFGAAGFIYDRNRAELFDERLAKPMGQCGTFAGSNPPVVHVVKAGDDSVMLIALDSNLETEVPFDFACGEISDRQLRGLNAILGNPDNVATTKLLFFHHHPFRQ